MEEFQEILQIVCSYLNENEVDYVVVGGVAVMYHGVPRTTVDIDIILQIDDSLIPSFADFLNSKGFDASASDLQSGFDKNSHSTCFFKDTLLRLDIQGVNSQFDKMTLDRALLVDFFDTQIRIGSMEDTLVNKILFQGEKDLRDALGIITRHREDLDFEYIESTCDMLGIRDLLEKFLNDVESKTMKS